MRVRSDASGTARRHAWAAWAIAGLLVVSSSDIVGPQRVQAQAPTIALPPVFAPFPGDPRLEPLPGGPLHLANIEVYTTDQFGNQKVLQMRFPPRVNGQNESDGDKHADLYVLYDAVTHQQIDQPVILEAVPMNAAPGLVVSERKARQFSPIWEMHAVFVDSSYDQWNLAQRIDSAEKVFSSPLVKRIIQTNIFLNCPVVPNGSTVDPGSHQPEPAFFEGQLVTIVPYDIEDGEDNVQVLFKFEDQDGNTLGRTRDTGVAAKSLNADQNFIPHIVTSHAIGDPFYTSLWDVWTVVVPNGTDVSSIRSAAAVKAGVSAGQFKIHSAGFQLDCPVVSVDGVPVPIEDVFDLMGGPDHIFRQDRFPIDVPAAQFTKSRTFQITELNPGGVADVLPTPTATFPAIDPLGKGNVIPLILKDPFGPSNSSGNIIRISQAELDAGMRNNPPTLPPAIEANFARLIAAGLLDPEWAPGGRSYQERLAIVGKALFKLRWTPEQGANSKDVTTCRACHSHPSDGASARGLYTLERAIPGRPEIGTQTNAGSMFGSGAAELLRAQLRAAGVAGLVPGVHGTTGGIAAIRPTVVGASNTHFGIEPVERVAQLTQGCAPTPAKCAGIFAAETIDLDGDGVVNEKTVGEITAESAFLLTTPLPDEASTDRMAQMGIPRDSVERGRRLFRKAIGAGGLGCATCHTPFMPLSSNVFHLDNPVPNSPGVDLIMPTHFANDLDVAEGYASFVGQPGLRLYGDLKSHDFGLTINNSTFKKTAELWDVGSDAPLLANGSMGSDIIGTILIHGGEALASHDAFAALPIESQWDVESFLRVQLIEGKTGEGSGAQPALPRKSVAQLKASATSIVNGGSVTLTWSTLNANSIFLSPGVGVVAESGSVTLSPTLTTTYRLVASNGAGPVQASVTVSVVNPTGSKTGLVAAYGFNEGKEAEAMDASGMGNTGMIFNAVRVDGHSGGGLAFNGFDTFVRVPHSGSLNLTSGMTLEAWVKPASNTHHSSVILKQHAVGGYTWLLYASDTAAATETSVQTQAGAFNTLDGAALAVGAWSHLAATYDGATYRLYINGSQVASVAASGTIQTSTLPLFIGGNIPFGDFFEGVVDDVRIYNRALSAAQIATDMSTPVP